jgi:hypothetical protein
MRREMVLKEHGEKILQTNIGEKWFLGQERKENRDIRREMVQRTRETRGQTYIRRDIVLKGKREKRHTDIRTGRY